MGCLGCQHDCICNQLKCGSLGIPINEFLKKHECQPLIWESLSSGNPTKRKMKVETLSFAYLLALTLLKHSFKDNILGREGNTSGKR